MLVLESVCKHLDLCCRGDIAHGNLTPARYCVSHLTDHFTCALIVKSAPRSKAKQSVRFVGGGVGPADRGHTARGEVRVWVEIELRRQLPPVPGSKKPGVAKMIIGVVNRYAHHHSPEERFEFGVVAGAGFFEVSDDILVVEGVSVLSRDQRQGADVGNAVAIGSSVELVDQEHGRRADRRKSRVGKTVGELRSAR